MLVLFQQMHATEQECQVWQVALLRQRALDAKQRMEHKVLTHALFEAPKAAMLRMGHNADAGRADERRRGRRRMRSARGGAAVTSAAVNLETPAGSKGDRSTWAASNASLFSPLKTPAKPPPPQLGTPAGGPLRRQPMSRAAASKMIATSPTAASQQLLSHSLSVAFGADASTGGELFGLRSENETIKRELDDILELVQMIR